MRTVEYVIFDLDGLLIDSEKVYTNVTNDILARYGKEMTIEIKAGLMGKPERAAAEHLLSFFPDIDLTADDYIRERREKQDALWGFVQPLPGALKLVEHLHTHSIPIAIATGSQRRNFLLKTNHIPHLIQLFGGHIVCAEDVERGKPHPDVFLAAAKSLGREVGMGDHTETDEDSALERSKGLVFEDAIPGVEGAIRAGMQVIWVPDHRISALEQAENLRAHQTLSSLEDFQPESFGLPAYASGLTDTTNPKS